MSKYNFNIDTDNQESLFDKSKINAKSQKKTLEDFISVDMGFATWSKYNLGVDPYILNEKKDWLGNLYAWGETIPNKKVYNWDSYTLFSKKSHITYDIVRYNNEDRLEILKKSDDAAYITTKNSIVKMKIPSIDDFKRLISYCKYEYMKNYNDIYNLNGILFTSHINNAELFFPYTNNNIVELWTNQLQQVRDESYDSLLKYVNDLRLYNAECFRMHHSDLNVYYNFLSQQRWKSGFIRPIAMKISNYEL